MERRSKSGLFRVRFCNDSSQVLTAEFKLELG